MSTKNPFFPHKADKKILLLGIETPFNKVKNIQNYFDEFLSLIKTLGVKSDEQIFIRLRNIDKATFLTKGKVQELIDFCQAKEIDRIICSEILSPLQERNLEELTNCEVWDREKLILEIFRNAAHSAEGKIQVEMAEIEFFQTRLAGKGIEFSQQAGFKGGRGPGETAKEVLKRHLEDKYRQAKKKLETLQRSREIQRKQRIGSNVPFICIIGYTNAGKSSLLNILTKSQVLAEDKLFATLDTTTRELFIDSQKKALISDTVGFISQLPHHLIEAFKSTLDELRYADLLLHVVDLSNQAWEDQIRVVHETLDDLKISKEMLYVFNKTDLLKAEDLKNLEPKIALYQPNVKINTRSKEGISELITFLKNYQLERKP